MKYRTYNPDQVLLIPPSITDMLLPESHVFVIMEIINANMVSGLETSKSEEGNAAFSPLMMARLLVWSYFNGIQSSRKIERMTYTDVEYLYLSAMQHPNFRTICEFRTKNAEFLSVMYKKLYHAAYEMGLTSMGILSIDGTHVKGNASGKKGCKKISRWQEIEKELEADIAHYEERCAEVDRQEDEKFGQEGSGGLPEEYRDAKKRRKKIKEVLEKLENEDKDTKVSLTDPDARYLKKKANDAYAFGYNVGLTVDENQLIAHVEMTNISSDQPGLKAGIEGVEETIGKEIPQDTKVLCDAGYFSADNIEFLDEKKLDGYIAPSMNFKTDAFEKEWARRKFRYDKERDVVLCRKGCEMGLHTPGKPPKRDVVYYKAKASCKDCPIKSECCPQGNHRVITFNRGVGVRTEMTGKMLSEESKKLYVKRKTTVEPTIGDMKWNLKFRSFNIRGFLGKVESGLVSLCHNIKRLANMTNVLEKSWNYV